jgi:hypothetical protein
VSHSSTSSQLPPVADAESYRATHIISERAAASLVHDALDSINYGNSRKGRFAAPGSAKFGAAIVEECRTLEASEMKNARGKNPAGVQQVIAVGVQAIRT